MGLLDSLKEAVTPDHEQAVRYQCLDCQRQFAYRADLDEQTCPYCDSTALERVDRP
ncbi:zinc ribbon domain-containing protein [Halorientalis salina]|uniref:zinc ribbon domain-containing protein n=1 Tax=Halorientalis salina TaxID=2932266 RepID=UPI0010AD148A|nr:zinc ribbon domain-containing protein [Halorientalis salina]